MTTTAAVAQPAETNEYRGGLSRVLSVARLHYTNKATVFTIPALILTGIFAVNLAIWAIIYNSVPVADRGDVSEGLQWSGSTFYIFVYTFVIAVQAINVTFPFALGYGVTRRHFALGTALALLGLAAVYSVALTVVASIERATDGWGFGGRMFTAIYFPANTWYEFLFVYFAYFALFFFTGAFFAAIYSRWRIIGLLLSFLGLAILIIATLAIIGAAQAWGELFAYLGALPPLGFVAWSFVPTAIAAVAAFLVIRRATPKG